MTTESEILGLRARIAELESRVDILYNHLGLASTEDSGLANARIIELIRQGNKIEAIKVYREIHNCGLAEAKAAVEALEGRLG